MRRRVLVLAVLIVGAVAATGSSSLSPVPAPRAAAADSGSPMKVVASSVGPATVDWWSPGPIPTELAELADETAAVPRSDAGVQAITEVVTVTGSTAEGGGATIELRYDETVPDDAKPAVEAGAQKWADILPPHPLPIEVEVRWETIEMTAFGCGGVGNSRYVKLEGANALPEFGYNLPLAERSFLAADYNPDGRGDDGRVTILEGDEGGCYRGLDGAVGDNDFTVVSLMMHELGHVLGWST
jgi:hypothetical protein